MATTTLFPACRLATPHFHFPLSTLDIRASNLLRLPFRVSTHSVTRLSSSSMSQAASESSAVGASDPGADVAAPGNGGDVLVQYVVLRRDLVDDWPVGSVVAQGCHASVSAIWSTKDDTDTIQYCSDENIKFMHKVTLEVKGETQILDLSQKLIAGGIAHKLWIEQPEDIPTCLATKPYPKSTVASYFKKLKLCK